MGVLQGKKVLLGVTAGIAAYKTAHLVRLLIKKGATVKVVMTPKAKDFITPLTLSTLSGNEVFSTFYEEDSSTVGEALWNNHVEMGLWADFFVVAPATANTLSKMANGEADNLLLAVYLSAKCPVFVAPAMDLDMYKHTSTKNNLKTLTSYGNKVIPAEKGFLASGLEGEGRMAEPEHIVRFLEEDIKSSLPLFGKKILITAGPTYEAIDPVRFLGNHSSGKMGFALAEEAILLGAEVFLISGPTALKPSNDSLHWEQVVTAAEMYEAVHSFYKEVDVAIMAAAVADYKPRKVAHQKIKKKTDFLHLELEKTKDILASMGAQKKNQILVGFALETSEEIFHAQSKLQKKNLDLIVLNSLRDQGAGFAKDTNQITIIDVDQSQKAYPLKSKKEVADDILQYIIQNKL